MEIIVFLVERKGFLGKAPPQSRNSSIADRTEARALSLWLAEIHSGATNEPSIFECDDTIIAVVSDMRGVALIQLSQTQRSRFSETSCLFDLAVFLIRPSSFRLRARMHARVRACLTAGHQSLSSRVLLAVQSIRLLQFREFP